MLLPLAIVVQIYITEHIAFVFYVCLVAKLYSRDKVSIFLLEDADSDFVNCFASIYELINHRCAVRTSFLEEWCF